MTLGQEFGTYARMLSVRTRRGWAEAELLIREINLGATAIGNRHHRPPALCGTRARAALPTITEIPLVTAEDLVEATQDCGAFVQVSGVLKRVAVKLSKTCNDLRLLSSGRAAASVERSTCRRARPAPRSCPARSIR